VDFSHYSCDPVNLAVELVNSDGRLAGKRDELMFLADLVAFVERHRELWMEDSQPPVEDDIEPVRRLRKRLRAVFESSDPDEAADILNRLLEENGAAPRISTHGGEPHLHFEPSGTSFARWVAVVAAMGLATVIVDQGVGRLGMCAAFDCHHVFLDTSRNRSRRHCSTTCSTRENVAAYRMRHRPD
jgi:predicted RNA-binding Zn ribbon-like protein